MSKKRDVNNVTLPMMNKQVRIGLPSGEIRAGTVIAEYDDALIIEDREGQTGIMYRQWIVELWEGYGEQPGETKESDTE